jgi:hypothetical protein
MTVLLWLLILILGAIAGWLFRDFQIAMEKLRREDRIFRAIQDRAEREAKP